MPSAVSAIISAVENQRKQLTKLTGNQLNSSAKREELRDIVEGYFRNSRPQIVGSISEEFLSRLDNDMQSLLSYCHKRGSRVRYVELLASIKRELITVDSHLVAGIKLGSLVDANPIDRQIIDTLSVLLPSAAAAYEQALKDLSVDDRLSWRGPATDLREAMRETLDHLAPDRDVESQPGYKPIEGAKRPTMKQKVRFILRNRDTSASLSEPAENATDAIEEIIGKLVRSVYNRSSVSTHTERNRDEVIRVLEFVRVVLCELLEIRR